MKTFDQWNSAKKILHSKKDVAFYINTREIWFTKIGQNIGYEENGKKNFERPVLVIKKIGNMFFVIPLTSKGKQNHDFYHKFSTIILKNPKYKDSSYAILSQVRVMDKKRFIEHVGRISKDEFIMIKEKLKALLL